MNNLNFRFIVTILFCSCLIFLISSCQKVETLSDEITVYYVATDEIVKNAISAFPDISDVTLHAVSFDSAEKMDEQFINDLNVGKAPDVIVINDQTTLDIAAIYKNTFLNLDSLISEDDSYNPDNYLQAALNGGKIDGKQFFLPISYNLPVLFYDNDIAESEDVSVSSASSLDELFGAIEKHIQLVSQEKGRSTLLNIYQKSLLTLLVRACNLEIVDSQGQYVLEKENLSKIVNYADILYNEQEKAYDVAKNFGSDFTSLASNALFLLWDNINLLYDARAFESLYAAGDMDHICVLPFSSINDTGYAGYINLSGAILESSKNKPAAYGFLRLLMDAYAVSSDKVVYTMPVNLTNFSNYMESLKNKENISQSGGYSVTIYPMSETMAETINDIIKNINICHMPNTVVENMLEESFSAYFIGTVSFDDCYTDFEKTLNIYLNE